MHGHASAAFQRSIGKQFDTDPHFWALDFRQDQDCGGGVAVVFVRVSSAMWDVRQARHQQPAASSGSGTAAGSAVHQHGSPVRSAMAQEKMAPQRVHSLIDVSAC